jgi:hypothetical protein
VGKPGKKAAVFSLSYSSAPKMEAVRSSETSMNVYRTTYRYFLEDSILHGDRCENLAFKKRPQALRKFSGVDTHVDVK